MTEPDRIRHLYKGVSHDLFSIIAPKFPDNVQSLITECKNYENPQSGRIFRPLSERPPEVTPHHSSCNDPASLVRDIVRNELRKFMVEIRATAFPSAAALNRPENQQIIQNIVQDELRSTMHSFTPATSTFAPALPTRSHMSAMQRDVPREYTLPSVMQQPT